MELIPRLHPSSNQILCQKEPSQCNKPAAFDQEIIRRDDQKNIHDASFMRLLDNKAKNPILEEIEQAICYKNLHTNLCFDLIVAFQPIKFK